MDNIATAAPAAPPQVEQNDALLRFLEIIETNQVNTNDPKDSICYDKLFEGSSSKDVIKEIKEKCDLNGIISKLDGSSSSSSSKSTLIELQSHINNDNNEIPTWV